MPVSEEIRGRIFDIQRFSTHDGRGIRTSVFFKGCPLRCSWCQNPEGLSPGREIMWLESRCIRCGLCTQSAAAGGLFWEDGSLRIEPQAPEDWGGLAAECPSGALRWCGEDRTVPEVMDVIRRDVPFYRHGGGGVTLTGGDPAAQTEFAAALLRQCRAEGISAAMETEAALPWADLEPLLGLLDEIYVDLKLLDDAEAKKYTGCGSENVRENLTRLLSGEHRKKVTVRTPLIPGITATEKNLREASAFLAALRPETPWELLNYNALAPAKYPLLGREFPLGKDLTPFSRGQMEAFADLARSGGMQGVFWEHGEPA